MFKSVQQKGRLCCKSSCHGCPALHRRAGLVAPRDKYSLAEGHLFFPYISPLIACNRSNLAFSRVLALLQTTFTEKRDEQCACCIRDEHTCGLYLIH